MTDRARSVLQASPLKTLAPEAIERAVDYDDWFLGEIEKGLPQIDRGEVLTHEAVKERLEKHPDRVIMAIDGGNE
jgi:predicted transcriptional regulator